MKTSFAQPGHAFVLLDDEGVVIQKQPHLQKSELDLGFIEAPDFVVCGFKQDKAGQFYLPEQPTEPSEEPAP